MDTVHAFLDRAKVVLTTAVTWLTVASGVVTTVVATVDIPVVQQVGAVVLTWLAAAVVIIRRVTPVDASERGVL